MNDLWPRLTSTIVSRLDQEIEFQENGGLSKNFRSSGRIDWYHVFCRLSDEKKAKW